jgi:ribonuclease J
MGIAAPLIPADGDLISLSADGLMLERRTPQPPCIVNQNTVVPHPGLAGEGNSRSRHGSLYVALSVMVTETPGWTRIGRLMLDASQASPFDEEAFADWLDEALEKLHAETLAELRLALQPKILAWFTEHLRRLPDIHLQILAVEVPRHMNAAY